MKPYYADGRVTLYHGDCLDVLRGLPDASVDAVVTDPPYSLSFMSKDWDRHATPEEFQAWCEQWASECLRVLKPGGHLLAFGGTRTWHRLACAIEDAGFEIRDNLAWLYGSGFPKSLDASKAIDKAAGAEREARVNERWVSRYPSGPGGGHGEMYDQIKRITDGPLMTSDPATPESARWQGWGTALKPAYEPIVMARKPLSGTVAATVLAWGTGALNVDGCRIGTREDEPQFRPASASGVGHGKTRYGTRDGQEATYTAGRWPANVVLDSEAAAMLDEQSGERSASGVYAGDGSRRAGAHATDFGGDNRPATMFADSGGASRFFYTAKADSSERPRYRKDGGGNGNQNYGGYKVKACDECGTRWPSNQPQPCGHDSWSWQEPLDRKPGHVAHPTVKPLDLMRWLVRLVTPPGGVVLEPFAGSGTTVEACILEGFRCVAIEREADYLPLVMQRVHRQTDPVAHHELTKGDDDEPSLFDLLGGDAA